MGAVKDIYDVLVDLIAKRQHKGFDARKSDVFNDYIDRPYQLLKQVHTDYLEIFAELRQRIVSKNGISSDTLNWLARARLKEQAHRSELENLELENILDSFMWSWGSKKPSDALNVAITHYGELVNRYFVGWRRVSHSREIWDGLKVLIRLTQTSEEIIEAFNKPSSDPFEAVEACQNYIADKIGMNEKQLARRVDNNIWLSRLLIACGIDPFRSFTSEDDSCLKDETGFGIEELNQKDSDFLALLLYRRLSGNARDFSNADETIPEAEIDKVSGPQFVPMLVDKLSPEKRAEWEEVKELRTRLQTEFQQEQFLGRILEEYIDDRMKILERRFSDVTKAYQQVKFFLVLLNSNARAVSSRIIYTRFRKRFLPRALVCCARQQRIV